MNPSVRLSWLVLSGSVLACVAILRAGSSDTTSPTSRPDIIVWGDPAATVGDEYMPDHLLFVSGAYKSGGDWLNTADGVTGWSVSPADPDFAALEIDLDRSACTNDLSMDVGFYDSAGAALYVDLLDVDGNVTTANVAGNLLAGSGRIRNATVALPLVEHPEASTVQLRCDYGGVAVYFTRFSIGHSAAGNGDGLAQGSQTSLAGGSSSNGLPDSGTLIGSAGSGDATVIGTVGQGDGAAEGGVVSNAAPNKMPVANNVVYVDQRTGNDWFSGRVSPASALALNACLADARSSLAKSGGQQSISASNAVKGAAGPIQKSGASLYILSPLADGPKATIAAGLAEAKPRDTIVVCSGTYGGSVNLAGTSHHLVIQGKVNLTGATPRSTPQARRIGNPGSVGDMATNAVPVQIQQGAIP